MNNINTAKVYLGANHEIDGYYYQTTIVAIKIVLIFSGSL